MAIVVLVHEGLYGSALAMLRVAFEACVRGMWLLDAATDEEIDQAGNGQSPNDFFGKIVADLEKPGRIEPGSFSQLKGASWKRLCSLTHTGYEQIGARLTTTGLGHDYTEQKSLKL